jgi:hypothetical protein
VDRKLVLIELSSTKQSRAGIMSLSAATVFEVRPGAGNSTNGGGFVTGATGTDYSQQNNKNSGSTDKSTTDAVANGTTTITSATANFASSIVGNIVLFSGGTGSIAAVRRQVVTFTNSTTIVLDAAIAASTGMTMNIGGAVASVADIATTVVAGNTIWQKVGTDTLSGAISITAGTVTAPVLWEGYNAARGDLSTASWDSVHTTAGFLDTTNFPVVAQGANQITVTFTQVNCISFTGTKTSGQQINAGGNGGGYFRCKFAYTGAGAINGVVLGTGMLVTDCDFSTVSQAGSSAISCPGGLIYGCRFTSTVGGAITSSSLLDVSCCLFYDLAAGETAVKMSAGGSLRLSVTGCTFDNVAGTCVSIPDLAQTVPTVHLINNQVTNCGTFANNLRSATQTIPLFSLRNRIRDTSTSYTGWYSNTSLTDITTAQSDANEYVDRANKNFRLKDGAAGQGQGYPRYLDIGALQRQEPTLPTAAQVLTGIGFGDGGTEFTGTIVLPTTSNVRNGTTFGARSGSTGTLVVPSTANVRSGITFDNGSTGVLVLPSITDVRTGTGFGANGNEFTGSLSPTSGGGIIGG